MVVTVPRFEGALRPWTVALVGIVFLLGVTAAVGLTAASHVHGTTNVTVYDGSGATFTDADDVERAIRGGLDHPHRMVAGETLVVGIESDRLADDVAAGNGTTTDRFFDVLDGNASLRLVQTNPTPERPRKVVRLGPRNATVYRAGNTTYALLDTARFDYRLGGIDENRTDDLYGGERFAVVFGYGPGDGVTAESDIELFDTLADLEVTGPLAPEVVNGTVSVNVRPEESLSVRGTVGNRTRTAPVEWTGEPRFSLDLRGVDSPTPYVLELVHGGTVVDRTNGTVAKPRATIRNVSLAAVDGQSTVNATVTLSHGGQVQVRNEGGSELGVAWVQPALGSPTAAGTNVSIDLHGDSASTLRLRAVRNPHDRPAIYRGSEATATIDVSDREIRAETPPSVTRTVSPSPTPTSRLTPTPTTSATEPDTSTPGPSPETPSDTRTATPSPTPGSGGPGFGIVAMLAATLSLLVVGLRGA